MSNVPFCNCSDQNCAMHPVNHQQGCTPCIAKNLKQGEIPACFFHQVEKGVKGESEYSMERFARFVLEHQEATV